MDPKKKERVAKILKRMGINHSEAINILYSLIEEYEGFPFELKLPDADMSESKTKDVRAEVISNLKESLKRNGKLGELLAK
jgi:addiction module RelB/DinJ family antitoxin